MYLRWVYSLCLGNRFILKPFIGCLCKAFSRSMPLSLNYSSYFGLFPNFTNIFVENHKEDTTFLMYLHIFYGSKYPIVQKRCITHSFHDISGLLKAFTVQFTDISKLKYWNNRCARLCSLIKSSPNYPQTQVDRRGRFYQTADYEPSL